MKTKAQIVGELLKDGKINAEDAVILLRDAEIKYVYINTPYHYPNHILTPYIISYGTNPLVTLCGTTTTNGSTAAFITLTNN